MMDHFRNSDLFKGTAASDFKGRFNALQGVESRAAEVTAVTEGNANLRLLSAAMVGVSDAVVYERTPGLIPHAGWERIESVLYTWLPSYFYREKQSLHDHNLILRQYLGEYEKNSLAITLTADCYRRFGWWAPPLGITIAWFVYGLWHRFVGNRLAQRDPLLGIVLAIGSLTFLQMGAFSTVLGTWWIWMYDIPKNFGALLLFTYMVRIFYPFQNRAVGQGRNARLGRAR